MRQDPPAEDIDDGGQIDEAARHGNVGDVRRPDLIGPFDLHPAQKIRIDLVTRRGFAGVRTAVDRRYSHAIHQARHMAPPDR
jgi:hypothetical protein